MQGKKNAQTALVHQYGFAEKLRPFTLVIQGCFYDAIAAFIR